MKDRIRPCWKVADRHFTSDFFIMIVWGVNSKYKTTREAEEIAARWLHL